MTPEERARFCASLFLDPAKVSSEKRARVEREIAVSIREAVKAEREACAKTCDDLMHEAREEVKETKREMGRDYDQNSYGAGSDAGMIDGFREAAHAIRARAP